MNTLEQRSEILELYNEAKQSGARQHKICQVLGLSPKTIQRWQKPEALQCDSRRTRRYHPSNKLTEAERQAIIDTCNETEFCEMTR